MLYDSTSIAQAIRDDGFAVMKSNHDDLFREVLPLFSKFIEEIPLPERARWILGNIADPDDGLVRKGMGDASPDEYEKILAGDNKFFFHYRPHIYTLLKQKGIDIAPHRHFFSALRELYDVCYEQGKIIMQAFDELSPGHNFLRGYMSPRAIVCHAVRLLKYNEHPAPGTELAAAHPDRNAATQALGDSMPGLRLYVGQGKIKEHHSIRGSMLVFPGLKAHFATLTSPQKIRALIHDVVAPEQVPTGAEARYSGVYFMHHNDDDLSGKGKDVLQQALKEYKK